MNIEHKIMTTSNYHINAICNSSHEDKYYEIICSATGEVYAATEYLTVADVIINSLEKAFS